MFSEHQVLISLMPFTELVFKKYILILALHWDCSSHSQ